MQSIDIKILLNREILNDSPPPQERRFSRVPATYIQAPDYNAKYFETLPTMWAEAYTFQRAIERADETAIEEWVSLFLLDYFGVLHLKRYERSTLVQEYDADLWPAISGTYPSPKGDALSWVELLHASSKTENVVGAYYPGILFFPSRGRRLWTTDEALQPYLQNHRLSWKKGCEVFLQNTYYRQKFYLHLMSIINLLDPGVKGALIHFCTKEAIFRGLQATPVEKLDSDPYHWPRPDLIPDGQDNLEEKLLSQYPFKKERKGGLAYYLVADMPITSEWMKTAIAPGLPAPSEYEYVSESEIQVRFAGKVYKINLGEDKAIKLKDLFLEKEPYYCAINKNALEARTPQIRKLHKKEMINNTGAFTQVKPDDVAVCLVPAKSQLFQHFPELLLDPGKAISLAGRTESGGLNWQIHLFGKSFIIPTEPKYSKALPDSQLAIWPPKVSPQWNLYVVHGTGAKRESCGRWHLIDETGTVGINVELATGAGDDEYVNILSSEGKPNRPMAMALRDSSKSERGILFLSPLAEHSASNEASLAVDFGTSNSCLAYKLKGATPTPIIFGLSPIMIWGDKLTFENPGFVPFKWGGTKGYFPTILLSRKNADFTGVTAENIEAHHLFATDVPGLHKEMEERVFTGELNSSWNLHTNLKWHLEPDYPWARPAFLGLLLLYAHAELFFNQDAKVNHYVFTFPLAFLKEDQDEFHGQAQAVIRQIRKFCYGNDDGYTYDSSTDESTAIAKSVAASPNKSVIEVFVDIGGGTTDIAIRYHDRYFVLDSIKMAGKSFFTFADDHFNSNLAVKGREQFLHHLGKLLLDNESEKVVSEKIQDVKKNRLDLGTFYSLAINRLDDADFKKKEAVILKNKMGWPSYQLYRTQLFFRHILTYALLQACAVAVDQKLTHKILTSGVNLILSGNGWGLMAFGQFRRSRADILTEAQYVLTLLKEQLLADYPLEDDSEAMQLERLCIENLTVKNVDLLNENNLSDAKTKVPVGALTNIEQKNARKDEAEDTHHRTYAGITMPSLVIGDYEPITIRWCDRWGVELLKRKLRLNKPNLTLDKVEINEPESYEQALNPHLSVFTRLGNAQNDEDQMPPEEWQKMNGRLCQGTAYVQYNTLMRSPINYFVSRILYPEDMEHRFLLKLAELNKMLE